MTSDAETAMPRLRLSPDEGRAAPVMPGHVSALVASWGTVEMRWYAPRGTDDQTPHDRDELYFVAAGTAVFLRAECRAPFDDDHELHLFGEERVAVKPGDVLFVPAGTVHRFEAMSPDFGTWMMFYGPEGGEAGG